MAQAEVELRLQQFGPNQLTGQKRLSPWIRFLLQFHQPLIYILLASTVISAGMGQWAADMILTDDNFAWEHGIEGTNLEEARAAVINVIVMVQTFYLLNCRSRTRSVFSIGFFSNPWLIAGILTTWVAQISFTYLPLLNRLFHTAPVRAEAWVYIVAIGVFAFAAVELEKWLRFRAPPPADKSPAKPTRRT